MPHHFAFRGADDATYVVSGWLAARAAKAAGVRTLVAQTMLNTPKHTWGVQDLAKSRALLALLRELEGRDFRVILQPRAGLDYFSADPAKAKAQLAAVTALMDDIEPGDAASPPIVHVVSWSEAVRFADPPVIAESVQITRHALAEYRRLRARGHGRRHGGTTPRCRSRTRDLLAESRAVIRAIEASIPDPVEPGRPVPDLRRGIPAGAVPVGVPRRARRRGRVADADDPGIGQAGGRPRGAAAGRGEDRAGARVHGGRSRGMSGRRRDDERLTVLLRDVRAKGTEAR